MAASVLILDIRRRQYISDRALYETVKFVDFFGWAIEDHILVVKDRLNGFFDIHVPRDTFMLWVKEYEKRYDNDAGIRDWLCSNRSCCPT